MALSREEIEHVAGLAHIALSDGEVEQLCHQLSSVIEHVSKLQQLATEDVPPTSQAVAAENVRRDDVCGPSWPAAKVLANAPHRRDQLFEVQAVLD
jgi:aspartyl-tRNA(Asn)/glutamyl-tRNA(Gln) amidotransferase subunit C